MAVAIPAREITSQETQNYYRAMSIILDEVPSMLRSYFVQEWNKKYPHNLWINTGVNGNFFLRGESGRQLAFLNQARNQGTRDLIQAGNACDWDSPTLFYALLYSSHKLLPTARPVPHCIPPLHPSEWIADLRNRRNMLLHATKASLSQADFNALITSVKQSFNGLGLHLHHLSQLETAVLSMTDMQILQTTLDTERNIHNNLAERYDQLKEKYDNLLEERSETFEERSETFEERIDKDEGKINKPLKRMDNSLPEIEGQVKDAQSDPNKDRQKVDHSVVELQKKHEIFDMATDLKDNDQEKESPTVIRSNLVIYEKNVISVKGQSAVYLGKFGARDVAVKRVPEYSYFLNKKYTQPEHKTLEQLFQHRNIVIYFDIVRKDGWIYLVLEKCNTDLSTQIEEWKVQDIFPDQTIQVEIGADICNGLDYLHKMEFIHRDIKPANILLVIMGDKTIVAKICDMGITRKLESGRGTFSESGDMGSAGYRPYEILEARRKKETAKHLSSEVDIFALGSTLHMMLSRGEHPFGETAFRDANILRMEAPVIDKVFLNYEAQDLIPKMIKHNAAERISLDEVREHPFFWPNSYRMVFLSNVSERIKDKKNRDPDSINFLDEFKDTVIVHLPGKQWSNELPVGVTWGGPKQMTPQQAVAKPEGSTLGLLRFIRNEWAHRVQNIENGYFASDAEIMQILLGSFPWIVTEVYHLCQKHFASNLEAWLDSV